MATFFTAARPIWEKGREKEMNYHLAYVAAVPKGEASLTLTAANAYALFVNGTFVADGPARCCHGWYRVDERDLTPYLTEEQNVVCIQVAAYNINNFEYVDVPPFLQAEILSGGKVLAATGAEGFTAVPVDCRVQKTQRYSFQRVFTEYYRMTPDSFWFRTAVPEKGVELVVLEDRALLPRGVKYLQYPRAEAIERVAYGTAKMGPAPEKVWEDRALLNISPILKGFKKDELECITSLEVQSIQVDFADRTVVPYGPQTFTADTGAIFRLAHNTAGLIGCTVDVKTPVTLYIAFDEILVDGDIQFWRASCTSVLKYDLAPGHYELLSVEPYVSHFLKVICLGGECTFSNLHVRQVICPDIVPAPKTNDPVLCKIYEAAVETFRQNAVDIFMDCPSRERAGWLCDSFWTSRVEYALTGETRIERNFLEHFLLPEKFDFLPDGVFPMCYPSDHNDEMFIPNWTMWLILELEEYLQRSGDRAMIDAFREKLYKLIAYFDGLTNSDGLLEKLESWVFLEWSDSNKYVQDVNYPSNMLFARTLEAVANLYGDEALRARAAKIKATVREQSLIDGNVFFTDNAVRVDGKLVNENHRTESCQYYAFFTGTATPETDPELWQLLTTDFGPHRKQTKTHPDVSFANAFIGNYLRLDLLDRYGLQEQLLKEIAGYFEFMADTTGTLWEHDNVSASCDHGFASHVIRWIDGGARPAANA